MRRSLLPCLLAAVLPWGGACASRSVSQSPPRTTATATAKSYTLSVLRDREYLPRPISASSLGMHGATTPDGRLSKCDLIMPGSFEVPLVSRAERIERFAVGEGSTIVQVVVTVPRADHALVRLLPWIELSSRGGEAVQPARGCFIELPDSFIAWYDTESALTPERVLQGCSGTAAALRITYVFVVPAERASASPVLHVRDLQF
jgi:hypothetical protein